MRERFRRRYPAGGEPEDVLMPPRKRFNSTAASARHLRKSTRALHKHKNEASGSGRATSGLRAAATIFSCRISDCYFVLLETSWVWLWFTAIIAYLVVICFMSLPLIGISEDELSGTPSDFEGNVAAQVLLFSTSNVLTMGWGQLETDSERTYLVATVQHFVGMLCNCFLLSVFVTKFQHPAPDIMFSSRVALVTRDGVPTLLFRIGNLRCNLIFNIHIEGSLLTIRETTEGESFMESIKVKFKSPAAITGCYTAAHTIDEMSPFFGIVDSPDVLDHFHDGHFVLSVVFYGHDPILHDEVFHMKRYRAKDFTFHKRFADVNKRHPETGKPFVDFSEFNRVVDIAGGDANNDLATLSGSFSGGFPYPDANATAGSARPEEALDLRGAYEHLVIREADPLVLSKDTLYVVVGGVLVGDRIQPACGFCLYVVTALQSCGIPIVKLHWDMMSKEWPAWFVDATGGAAKEVSYPLAQIRGEWLYESEDILQRAREVFGGRVERLYRPVSDEVAELPDRFKKAFFAMILSEKKSAEEKAAMDTRVFRPVLDTMERLLHAGPNLSGHAPAKVDFFLACLTHSALAAMKLYPRFAVPVASRYPAVWRWYRERMLLHLGGAAAVDDSWQVVSSIMFNAKVGAPLTPEQERRIALAHALERGDPVDAPRGARAPSTMDELREGDALALHPTQVFVVVGGVRVGDRIRPSCEDSLYVVAALQSCGVPVVKLLGDATAEAWPAWFVEATQGKAQAVRYPFAQIRGEWLYESGDILQRAREVFRLRVEQLYWPLPDEVVALPERLRRAYDAMLASKDGAEAAPGLVSSLWQASDAVRKSSSADQESFTPILRAMETLLQGAPYLGGQRPTKVDFAAAATLHSALAAMRISGLGSGLGMQLEGKCPAVWRWYRERMLMHLGGVVSVDAAWDHHVAVTLKATRGVALTPEAELRPAPRSPLATDEIRAEDPLVLHPSLNFIVVGGMLMGDRIRPSCGFCLDVVAALQSCGVPIVQLYWDMTAKAWPAWFVDATGGAAKDVSYPFAQIRGEWLYESEDILQRAREVFRERVERLYWPVSDEVAALPDRFKQAFFAMILSEQKSAEEKAAVDTRVFRPVLDAMERLLRTGPYLSGHAPAKVDFFLACLTHSALTAMKLYPRFAVAMESRYPAVWRWYRERMLLHIGGVAAVDAASWAATSMAMFSAKVGAPLTPEQERRIAAAQALDRIVDDNPSHNPNPPLRPRSSFGFREVRADCPLSLHGCVPYVVIGAANLQGELEPMCEGGSYAVAVARNAAIPVVVLYADAAQPLPEWFMDAARGSDGDAPGLPMLFYKGEVHCGSDAIIGRLRELFPEQLDALFAPPRGLGVNADAAALLAPVDELMATARGHGTPPPEGELLRCEQRLGENLAVLERALSTRRFLGGDEPVKDDYKAAVYLRSFLYVQPVVLPALRLDVPPNVLRWCELRMEPHLNASLPRREVLRVLGSLCFCKKFGLPLPGEIATQVEAVLQARSATAAAANANANADAAATAAAMPRSPNPKSGAPNPTPTPQPDADDNGVSPSPIPRTSNVRGAGLLIRLRSESTMPPGTSASGRWRMVAGARRQLIQGAAEAKEGPNTNSESKRRSSMTERKSETSVEFCL